MKFTTIVILVLLMSSATAADIYRWIDENGEVQYGDKNDANAPQSSEKVTIKDKYSVREVVEELPIPYEKEEANRVVSFKTITLNVPESDYSDVRIGRITCGKYPIDLYWTKGIVGLESSQLGDSVTQPFVASGYTVENSIGSISVGGSLQLKAVLKKIKLKVCAKSAKSKRSKNASYVEVDWVLYDPVLDKTLTEVTTHGSHHALNDNPVVNGTNLSFNKAISMAAINLLAQKEFVQHLTPADLESMKEVFAESIDIELLYGNRSDRFNNIVTYLKQNSAIVKSEGGHGSGVLISDKGYLLTNAHVVGDKKNFIIDMADRQYNATLIRKEIIRDVALLKIDDYDGKQTGVKVAREQPGIGETLFVIGTPLKLEFQHTITKGIVSAKRNMGGLPYLQTDAAINRGNSGGPVFDETGELIGLTVSGIFTQGGASMNINYRYTTFNKLIIRYAWLLSE